MIGFPLGMVLKNAKGISEEELAGLISDAENDAQKWKISRGARAWNILMKELKLKHGKQKTPTGGSK